MDLQASKLGKRFGFEWIFQDLDFNFSSGNAYAITGPNGSGKSTLIQVVSGSLNKSVGELTYIYQNKKIEIDSIYKYIALSAPYLELIEEFTLLEHLKFHFKFKTALNAMSLSEMIDIMYLNKDQNKPIKQCSSGMKQRVKLGLAVFSDCPLLLLDEPTSNLDKEGCNWYLNLLEKYRNKRTILIASNDKREYEFCKDGVDIMKFKG